ncbi:hypothetical protein [uncultured Desulfobacter sp.]|uniref:hypothetical protein n=1 Tax=uncultured Desulfobacter sp. TaxID=240139 RepID=UPI002AA6944C|nr:hypothetical protein [uncultured Desulfobacter sp.]
MMQDDLKPGSFVDTAEAARIIGSTPGTLTVWRCYGRGPKFVKFGRNVRYYKQHLLEFALGNTHNSTSEVRA